MYSYCVGICAYNIYCGAFVQPEFSYYLLGLSFHCLAHFNSTTMPLYDIVFIAFYAELQRHYCICILEADPTDASTTS